VVANAGNRLMLRGKPPIFDSTYLQKLNFQ